MPTLTRRSAAAGRSAPSHSPIRTLLGELDAELQRRREQRLFRTLSTLEAIDGPRIRLGGRWLVNWSSNDYLGL